MANLCLFVRDLLLAVDAQFGPYDTSPYETGAQKQMELEDAVVAMLDLRGLRRFSSADIRRYFSDDGNLNVSMADLRQFIILRGPNNDVPMVPVLGLSVDMDGSSLNGLMVSLALYLRDDENGELRALGYRFEEPSDGPGIHYFYHAQNVRQFKPATYLPLPTPSWIPDSQPSFPLQATTPAALLVCALVAVYGGRVLALRVEGIRDYFQEGPAPS